MTEPRTHYVVFHIPGPAWQPGVDFREQPGVGEHVRHYAGYLEQGKLRMGGPFLDESGGLMVATPDVTGTELEDFAASDPAVRGGLLKFEIRPWYVAMQL